MMSKYNSIIIKIKLFYLILIGRIKKNTDTIQIFKNKNKKIKNILIIFPVNEQDFRVALYSFRDLVKTKEINYYFLINTVFSQHFHLSGYTFNLYQNIKNISFLLLFSFLP